MYSGSTLSHFDAVLVVELFEQGLTAKSASLSLDLAPNPVQMLYQRWQLRGRDALVTSKRRQYDFGTKLEIVLRHVGANRDGLSPRNTGFLRPVPSPTGRVSIDARAKTGCDSTSAAGLRP